MLAILSGTNRTARTTRMHELAGEGAEVHEERSGVIDLLEQLTTGGDLFAETHTVIFREVLGDDELAMYLETHAQVLHGSPHHIIFDQEKLPKEITEALGAYIEIHDGTTGDARPTFSPFRITDAVSMRDRKQAWLLYQEARAQGIAAEEIQGVLLWHTKTLLMVSCAKGNPGLKPFVYSKTQKALQRFSAKEVAELSSNLIVRIARSRRGEGDLSLELEQFLLTV